MQHERNINETGTGGSRTSDTALKEKLRLFTAGYIYHPRFISFRGFLGGSLRQDKFERNAGAHSPWTSSSSDEYGLRAKILPQHPYSLELFTERRTPLVKGRVSSEYKPVYYDRGVIFRYKKRLSSLTLSSTENINEYGRSTAETVTSAADGSYAIGPFSNSAGHRVTESVIKPSQARTTQVFSYFDNTLQLKDAGFTSHIDRQTLSQDDPLSASSYNNDALTWKEDATIRLPWNFQTSAGYSLTEETIIQKWMAPESETALSRETETTNYIVSHQLYHSLSTTYYANNISNRSTNGFLKTQSRALTSNYIKKTALGRFNAGIFARRTITDINNAPTIPDEIHTIAVTVLGSCITPDADGCFDLKAQNVDESSIIVRVKNPYPPGELIILTSSDYDVTPTPGGNGVRITIKTLPFAPAGTTYEFRATYSFIQQMVEYETTTMGYNVKFELFDNLINPYFGYSKQDQEVLSGRLPGGPQNSRTETVGLLVLKAPYSFTEEYQSVVSTINSSRTFKSMIEYRKNMTANASMHAKTYYTSTNQEGSSTGPYATFGVNARMQINVPRKNVAVGFGLSYYRRDSFTTSETYSWNSSLTWKIGKLLLTAGAMATESVSTSQSGKNTVVSEQYYLSLSRKLF